MPNITSYIGTLLVASGLIGCSASQNPHSAPIIDEGALPPAQIRQTEPPEYRRIKQGAWSEGRSTSGLADDDIKNADRELEGYDGLSAQDSFFDSAQHTRADSSGQPENRH